MLFLSLIKKKCNISSTFNIINIRNGHTMRGKRPGLARTLNQRLAEDYHKENPHILPRVNIGFATNSLSRSQVLKSRIEHVKKNRNDPQMEKLAKNHELLIDLNEVEKDAQNTVSSFVIKKIADHYGIFDTLFGNAYFVPRIIMQISYLSDENQIHPVHHGNILTAGCSTKEPKISFELNPNLIENKTNENSYYTVAMVNPDTHLFSDQFDSSLNWFIGNIPSNKIEKGQTIVQYLQPFPVKGMGYQRNIFILFKHNNIIDYDTLKAHDSSNLEERKFNMLNFYTKYQDEITPVGLSFFQSVWDETVSKFFKEKQIKEPIFEYDFPKPYMADQKWFPLRQPFNLYLDKHRSDPTKIKKEYLEKYLFKDLDFEVKYPMAHPIKDVPSWMVQEIKKERLKLLKQNEKQNK